MVTTAVGQIEHGRQTPVAQDHSKAVYCKLISKEDGHISWNREAAEIERQIRAYYPWPVAYTFCGDKKLSIRRARAIPPAQSSLVGETGASCAGRVLRVDKARGILIQTNHGVLAVEELQLQSRKALGWKAFLNGTPDFVGSDLGGD